MPTRALPVVLLLLACLSMALTGPAGRAQAEELRFFRIATGSAGGTYFPVGAVIASAISNPPGSRPCELGGSCGVPGLIAVAHTADGSVSNVTAVARRLVDSALAQADVLAWAYAGEGQHFRRNPLPNLRVIANLYPESLHLVVRRSAGIRRVQDLAGRRVSLDRPGSGTRVNAELVLASYGLASAKIKGLEIDAGRAIDLMLAGELDAFFMVAGYPAPAVADLAALGQIDLLPIAGAQAQRLVKRHRFFAPDVIPAGAYDGIGEVATLSIGAQWVVAAEADEELIYQITRSLWHERNRELLTAGHPKASLIRLETALSGVSIPLHPGAERYYREVGLIPAARDG